MAKNNSNIDIDSYWEYSDPAKSEDVFKSALEGATADEKLELQTQIARTTASEIDLILHTNFLMR